jgi:hypothetical protein
MTPLRLFTTLCGVWWIAGLIQGRVRERNALGVELLLLNLSMR